MTETESATDDEPVELKGAQKRIRDGFFAHDSGLFTLSCVPGAGKSTVAQRLAPEEILRRYVNGDATPEQHVAVITFNRDEATDIIPEICEQLRAIVKHDLRPIASEVSEEEVELLIQRIHQAPYFGTVDSLLRGVLQEFATEIGFNEMPSVGNGALLAHVHEDCYDRVRGNSTTKTEIELLEAAYPEEDYAAGPSELLENAVTYCRNRRLTTEAFRRNLKATRDAVYDDKPKSFEEIADTIGRVVGNADFGNRAKESVTESDQKELVAADKALYESWDSSIDAFCDVLTRYREEYRALTREYGVLSHTDVAYLVASYFEGDLDSFDCVENINRERQQRILQRYQSRLQSLIIDEAQDISNIQHAALSYLAHPGMRVFACGDVLQSIYLWRHAEPGLFQSATDDGEYLGINWSTHSKETATTTYRCVPDIAKAVNEIVAPVFNDDARGNIGDLDPEFSPLEAARNSSEEPSVHISAFSSLKNPGSPEWSNPEDGTGEADKLAKHLSNGLADGTFTDPNNDPLGITVLFRKRARMEDYEAAFEDERIRVRNASDNLFGSPTVQTLLAVCDWLIEPGSPKKTRQLVKEGDIGLSALTEVFKTEQWDIDAVAENHGPTLSESQHRILTELQWLRDHRSTVEIRPASVYLEDIIERLALRADPDDLFQELNNRQRAANLDALIDLITEWEADDRYNPRELIELVAPFREDPNTGPSQPSISSENYDVEFRTVHQAKGDEDDVVVIADPGFSAWTRGPHTNRFVTQGSIAGLAPPTNVEIPEIEIPAFDNGIYNPDAEWERDIGLRWATAQWADSVSNAGSNEFVGPVRLQRIARSERAEVWRLLYVALTRARNHLVMPLPVSLSPRCYRDRWIESLQDGMSFDGSAESYSLKTDRGRVDIGVNDTNPLMDRSRRNTRQSTGIASEPVHRGSLAQWVPRFLNPSSMYPLTEDPDDNALAHLLGESIHTDSNDISDNVPLQLDTFGPNDVGEVIHAILTKLVEKGVSEAEIRSKGTIVNQVFDDIVQNTLPQSRDDERNCLWEFFTDVVDDFVESDLWTRIQRCNSVQVEQPIDGLVQRDGVEIEIHGTADFVVDMPSGDQYVTDIKTALTEQTPQTQKRYELQVSTYAYLFSQKSTDAERVHPTIETFGVERETVTKSWQKRVVERRIRLLLDKIQSDLDAR